MSAELGKQILEAVKAYVAAHVQPLAARVHETADAVASVRAELQSLPAPEKGEKGEPGTAGRTPTDDELRALITPLISAPKAGERGEKGEKGERGEPGQPGERGPAPTPEEIRAVVEPLIPAPIAGEKGERGHDGADGKDGRDALQLEILPQIDEAKSYARGTFARHAGGLWRSFEATHGLRGWECIVDGIAGESESLSDDGRTLTRKTIYSSGREFERSFSLAVILDKGVYKADVNYVPGDAVTWAGSVWIAQKREGSAVYGKPGTPGSGWRLSVKAGRDARQ